MQRKRASIERYAFIFDFDGTLVDIADTPGGIAVPPDLGADLADLRRLAENALAIVTGRRIADIDDMLSPYCFDVAGVHGTEMRVATQHWSASPVKPEEFRKAVAELIAKFGGRSGIIVEDKGQSVAVHWRLDPGHEPEIRDFIAKASSSLGGSHRIQLGKAVAEIVPRSANKGRAIELLLGHSSYAGKIPLFFGDDLTDESGFEVVNRAGGDTIHVGVGSTAARYKLPNTSILRNRISAWAHGAAFDPRKDFA